MLSRFGRHCPVQALLGEGRLEGHHEPNGTHRLGHHDSAKKVTSSHLVTLAGELQAQRVVETSPLPGSGTFMIGAPWCPGLTSPFYSQ